MHGELANAVRERRARGHSFVEPLPQPRAHLPAPGGEDLLDEIGAADRDDRVEERSGEAVVIGREEVLGVGRHVVQVPWPANPVALHGVVDEAGLFERAELLEDAGPARAEVVGEAIRRHGSAAEVHEDRPAQRRGRRDGTGAVAGPTAERRDGNADGGRGVGVRDGIRHRAEASRKRPGRS